MNTKVMTVLVGGALGVSYLSLRSNGALPKPPLYSAMKMPAGSAVFSATREVRFLLVDGADVWAATPGGVLRFGERAPEKFTTGNGLPTNEIRALRKAENGIVALSPLGAARFDGVRWERCAATPQKLLPVGVAAQTSWRGGMVRAAIGTIDLVVGKSRRRIPFPPSSGSHISALLARQNGELWAALFGDGLWVFDGRQWRRPAQPAVAGAKVAREVLSMAEQGGHIIIGTRRDGVWRAQDKRLFPIDERVLAEPFDHNAQAMTLFGGALFVSSLEDGLSVRTGQGWRCTQSELSSNAPRQMMPFRGALWLRHGSGAVDKFDGLAWTKNVFPVLPRQKTMALACDEKRLYLGQWGGWSEWDGTTMVHRLALPELQGLPPMALLPDGDKLWFATQSKGIAEIERGSGQVRWHDERNGLPDDWVTCLLRCGDTVFAGTFVGGLSWWDGKAWHTSPELRGENITALENDGSGGVFVATRHGVWHRAKSGKMTALRDRAPWLESEAQTLLKVPEGLWVGARTGVFYVKGV